MPPSGMRSRCTIRSAAPFSRDAPHSLMEPTMANAALSPELAALLATRRDGYGMPRGFYHEDALYPAEVARIWNRGWLFAGFTVEIPKPGDYLTLNVDGTPVLVMRDDHNAVRAFHNVCRHRGTVLCRKDAGHARAIVCPYHSWTYSRQGDLIACHGMH